MLKPNKDQGSQSTPKRVLFITHTAALGGGEIALLRLLEALDRSQFSPIALLFEDGPLAAELRPLAETHVIPLGSEVVNIRKNSLGAKSLLRVGAIWRLLRFAMRVRQFIRRHNVDLVHTNSLKADIIGGVSARIAGKLVIWHVRDRISADYLPKPAVAAFRFLASVIPTHVIVISKAVLRTLGGDLATGKSRNVTVVLDGIRLFDPIPAANHAYPAIGLIGRISSWKGQHIFVQAAALVHDRHPDAKFRVIGAALFGEHEYERELHSLTAGLAMEEVVEFTGFRNDIQACIAGLDIVVHASTAGEPFGQVILEGMAAAKPVVATAGGGVPEIIEDKVNGLMVPMNDVSAMADAISWLLDNPKLANDLGSNGRRRVEEAFGIERVAREVESVFSTVLSGPKLGNRHQAGKRRLSFEKENCENSASVDSR